jgi:hypothetical protein
MIMKLKIQRAGPKGGSRASEEKTSRFCINDSLKIIINSVLLWSFPEYPDQLIATPWGVGALPKIIAAERTYNSPTPEGTAAGRMGISVGSSDRRASLSSCKS